MTFAGAPGQDDPHHGIGTPLQPELSDARGDGAGIHGVEIGAAIGLIPIGWVQEDPCDTKLSRRRRRVADPSPVTAANPDGPQPVAESAEPLRQPLPSPGANPGRVVVVVAL